MNFGVAECRYELPSSRSGARASPALLPGEKGARILVPSPWGEGGEGLRQENHISIQQYLNSSKVLAIARLKP